MKFSHWRTRGVAFVALLLPQLTGVSAVSLTGCNSQNTGTEQTSNIYMSNGKCHDTCQAKGTAFAITQDQSCWCSNVAPPSSSNAEGCDAGCPGYPFEKCGNKAKGLYGYIALGKAPTSTAGGDTSSSSSSGGGGGFFGGAGVQQPSSVAKAPSPLQPPPPPPSTVVSTSVQTTTNTPDPSTVIQTSASTEVVTSASTATVTPSESSTVTPSPSVVTSHNVVTVSGAAVTQVITTTPGAQPDNRIAHQTRNGLSNGAVAGITVGALAGAAAIGALAFFLCWRKRKNAKDSEGNGSITRTGSVMSKMGLLRTGSATSAPLGGDPHLPEIITTVPHSNGPESSSTNMSENRRNSRPIFVDSRLNPNAVMMHNDHSRTSIATLQDNQDYSRPLEVRNPDEQSRIRRQSARS